MACALLCGCAASLTLAAPSGASPYVVTPPPNPHGGDPKILRLILNKRHFDAGDQIRMRVITSHDVIKVTNHELGHGGDLHKVAPGIFVGHGEVKGVPGFLQGMKVDMHYTATNQSGASVTVTVPVTF